MNALDPTKPHVTGLRPLPGSSNNRRDLVISADVHLPSEGYGVNPGTLQGNVLLYETDSGAKIPGNPNTDGAGGNITFQPTDLLKANTRYTFEVKAGLQDEKGNAFIPYKSNFTTGLEPAPVEASVKFTSQQVYPPVSYSNALAPVASLTMSRDNKALYGATLDGRILRWAVQSSGALSNPPKELVLPELQGRAIIGLEFDPSNTQVLWITHNHPLLFGPGEGAPEFSGKISRITLDATFENSTIQDYVVGLPRSTKDHLTNSLTFGPDGKLYVSQGSNTATGAYDGYWARHEQLLSGAILQVDPKRPASELPINVQTADIPNPYNPNRSDAPVKIFADGVRNAYDLVWHSNGYLYVPTNGSAAGGNTPASPDGTVPALMKAPVQKDFLFKMKTSGGYYGHPNPLRGYYVLNGGNPTEREDIAEVVTDASNPKDVKNGYPVGVKPHTNYKRPAFDFGHNRSPNGVIEYGSSVFGSRLKGKLLVVEYAGGDDVLALTLGSDGNVTKAEQIGIETPQNSPIIDPLDITEGPNGTLYIAELVTPPSLKSPPRARVRLLKPAP